MMKNLNLFFEENSFTVNFFKENVSHFETDIENCDWIISCGVDFGNTNKKEIQTKLNRYLLSNKKVIFFLNSDFSASLNVPENVLLFRTSMYKSLKKHNEYLLPYIWENSSKYFSPLPKSDKPHIGFCGNTKNNLGFRQSCINRFQKSKKITTKIISRSGFWGGKPNDKNYIEDFENNVKETHFTLCNRGKGNFSIRFYQILSMGRIPILIDSDMVFPFEKEIDWEKFIVKSKSESKLIRKLLDFWETKSDTEIQEIQEKCKKIHEEYFEPKSFGNKIHQQLINYECAETKKSDVNKFSNYFKFPEFNYRIQKKVNVIMSIISN